MKKIILMLLIGTLIMSSFGASNVSSTSTEIKKSNSNETYQYGAFVLTSTNIEGVPEEQYIGGLFDLDITASCNEFIIATYPIWGTAIIDENVDIHIHIDHFLGIIEPSRGGEVDVLGICENITWEII